MAAEDFSQKYRVNWPRLPDDELDGLSDEHKEMVRQFEEICMAGECEAFSDIIKNCTDKYQFAKTYNMLRDDWRKTLANLPTDKSGLPLEVNRLITKVGTTIIQHKLDGMAMWFWVQWSDSPTHPLASNEGPVQAGKRLIEQHTNSGCVIGLLLLSLASASLASACSFIVVLLTH